MKSHSGLSLFLIPQITLISTDLANFPVIIRPQEQTLLHRMIKTIHHVFVSYSSCMNKQPESNDCAKKTKTKAHKHD